MTRLEELYDRAHQRALAVVALTTNGLLVPKRKRRYLEISTPHERWRSDDGKLALDEDAIGLRHAGNVVPEMRDRRWLWQPDEGNPMGWYTNIDGESYRDGDGLVWGVVYVLPGRRGETRFIAGWQEGGWSSSVTLDLTRIFTEPRSDHRGEGYTDMDACRNAARYADQLAQEVSEDCQAAEYEQREAEEKAAAEQQE